MDWPNENYVRLYTRETDDDLVLSWEARAVWHEMLKRFDRSGLIELRRGRKGLAAVLRVPVEVVERGVPELIEDGRIRELESGYFAPNFMEAQEATKSDRQRQKESRERRRSKHAVTDQDEPVTNRDETSRHVVTKRDAIVTRPREVVTLTSADPDPLPGSAELPAASEALPPPAQIYPKTQLHNPRIKLNHDAWAYAALARHARVNDFYDLRHRTVFQAMRNLEAANTPIDVVTSRARSRRPASSTRSAASRSSGELALCVPTPDNVLAYAREVEDKSRIRQLGQRPPSSPSAASSRISRSTSTSARRCGKIGEIDRAKPDEAKPIGEYVKKRVLELEDLVRARESGKQVTTGIPSG
jgi:hypothetical protein